MKNEPNPRLALTTQCCQYSFWGISFTKNHRLNLSRKLENKWDKWALHCKFTHQPVFVIWLQLSPLVCSGLRLMSLDWNWFLWELLVAIKPQTQRWLGRLSAPQPWWWHERWQILCESHHPLSEQSVELGTHTCPRYPHFILPVLSPGLHLNPANVSWV